MYLFYSTASTQTNKSWLTFLLHQSTRSVRQLDQEAEHGLTWKIDWANMGFKIREGEQKACHSAPNMITIIPLICWLQQFNKLIPASQLN